MNTYDPNSFDYDDDSRNNEPVNPYSRYGYNIDMNNASPNGRKPKKNGRKKAAAFIALAAMIVMIGGGAFFGVRAITNKVSGTAEAAAIGSTQDALGQAGESRQAEGQAEANEAAAAEAENAEAENANADENASAGTITQEGNRIGSTSEANQQTTLSKASSETKYNLDVADIAENTMPAMVAITNTSVEKVRNFFYGGFQDYESVSKGTGVIVGQNETEILIATNAHVINNADTISVTFVDETTVEGAVKGSDTKNDLAVVAVPIESISADTLAQIKFVEIGDSDKARVGEQVVAIGNALGYGQSVSSGYLSAKNRGVETEEEESIGLLQTDAAINPGNSGGALLNMQGQLIGINSAKYAQTEVEGMGFAIPINTAAPILEKMMNMATRTKVDPENAAYLGISCISVSEEAAQYYHIPEGVYVQEVTPGSAADKAGVKQGDIITAIGEDVVGSDEELTTALEYYAAGETSTITVSRAGAGGQYSEESLTITFDARPSNE